MPVIKNDLAMFGASYVALLKISYRTQIKARLTNDGSLLIITIPNAMVIGIREIKENPLRFALNKRYKTKNNNTNRILPAVVGRMLVYISKVVAATIAEANCNGLVNSIGPFLQY